jgi:hypothetical protein
VLTLQRFAGNQATVRALSGKAPPGRVLQRVKGDARDPHMVAESEFRIVPAGEHVHLPNISGCAAVSLTVFGKRVEGEDEQVLAHIAFHSEGQRERSDKPTTEMAEKIRELPGVGKRVAALAILNGHQFDSRQDHAQVLEMLQQKLKSTRGGAISLELTFRFEKLIRDTEERETIDLTGGTETTFARYEPRFRFNEQESKVKREAFAEYQELAVEARKLNVFKKDLRRGRGRVKNSNYVPQIKPQDFAKLEPAEAQEAVETLRSKVDASKGCCVIL